MTEGIQSLKLPTDRLRTTQQGSIPPQETGEIDVEL